MYFCPLKINYSEVAFITLDETIEVLEKETYRLFVLNFLGIFA